MTVSEQDYLRLVLADPDEKWELYCGELRRKPPMTWEHIRFAALLHVDLQNQLDRTQYVIISEAGRVRRSARNYFIPDVMVIPVALARKLFPKPGLVASFPDPLPFVAEVWSSSTGDYDVMTKLPEYQRRGDAEVWLIYPYERIVTAWVRPPNGDYIETVHCAGRVRLAALPGVVIDLDALFTP